MFSQFVFNQLKKIKRKGLYNKIIYKLLEFLRMGIVHLDENKLVEYNLEDFTIKIPLRHDLPIIKNIYSYYNTAIGRIPKYLTEKYQGFQIIDIGANIGDTAIIIKSNVDLPILCIEGDGFYFQLLKENTKKLKDIYYENSFVGTGEKLDINFMNYKGSARLTSSQTPNRTIEFKSLNEIISNYSNFNNVKYLKIDTDGYDCKIIKHNMDFISVYKPVIFFEYDPYFLKLNNDDGISTLNDLANNGYDKAIIYNNTGEMLLSLSLKNEQVIRELHLYYSNRQSDMYMDICTFHSIDDDIAEKIEKLEYGHYYQLKNVE
ncbi:MAG: FkbM family methyltransferase [Ignavibacterium album]|uniref:FkbM family methyltransferase n=1 Tax=Ignavibacterium album TaxID=591197 RepID=UPI0026EF91DD|nr:FkbM family methyltransferase [Ignavibacterium album]MCX8105228.1 FkbM family methyltransferase [Ignavibacterium album]